jgi:hypothetical protein
MEVGGSEQAALTRRLLGPEAGSRKPEARE